MNATWKKHARRQRRISAALHSQFDRTVCVRCGMHGRHFVPPSSGEAGFFICDQGYQNRQQLNEHPTPVPVATAQA